MIKKIELCFDMAGCPNNCGHCWIKTDHLGIVKEHDVRRITSEFKSLAEDLSVYTWYLEPDYLPNYRELWHLEMELSTQTHQHFDLLSDWRVLQDESYLQWAYDLGVRTCQLTFFGMEETTNRMTGRPNAFTELLITTDKLIEIGISPRFQLFVYNFNVHEIKEFDNYIKDKGIKKKCEEKGLDFSLFIHTGSCTGNAMSLYDEWLTEDNILEIPKKIINSTKSHFGTDDINNFLGETESSLYRSIINDDKKHPVIVDDIILYVDGKLDVYPHFVVHKPWWKLGNLNQDSAEVILSRYLNGETIGQKTRKNIPVSEMVKRFGDPDSNRVFNKDDYIEYITEKYLEWNQNNIMREYKYL